MRVIAGSAKKTKLKMPGGGKVRPTADRVKESLFNILGPRVTGARVLDLFAGSGALGIEALSRGARHCVFVERDRRVAATLRENLERTKLVSKSSIITQDIGRALRILFKKNSGFDIIFVDPPYIEELELAALEKIHDLNLINSGGLVVVESYKKRFLPDQISSLEKERTEKYGDTVLNFYFKKTRFEMNEKGGGPRCE